VLAVAVWPWGHTNRDPAAQDSPSRNESRVGADVSVPIFLDASQSARRATVRDAPKILVEKRISLRQLHDDVVFDFARARRASTRAEGDLRARNFA
jgi:hypothetical protein